MGLRQPPVQRETDRQRWGGERERDGVRESARKRETFNFLFKCISHGMGAL